jgi:hypothetical protein
MYVGSFVSMECNWMGGLRMDRRRVAQELVRIAKELVAIGGKHKMKRAVKFPSRVNNGLVYLVEDSNKGKPVKWMDIEHVKSGKSILRDGPFLVKSFTKVQKKLDEYLKGTGIDFSVDEDDLDKGKLIDATTGIAKKLFKRDDGWKYEDIWKL